jgi:maltodextrin utilization protein YvdJ
MQFLLKSFISLFYSPALILTVPRIPYLQFVLVSHVQVHASFASFVKKHESVMVAVDRSPELIAAAMSFIHDDRCRIIRMPSLDIKAFAGGNVHGHKPVTVSTRNQPPALAGI